MPAAALAAIAAFQMVGFRKNHQPVFEVIIFVRLLFGFFGLLFHG